MSSQVSKSGSSTRPGGGRAKRAPVQLGAAVVGVVFLLVGVLGFIPGITHPFMQMQLASHDSDAYLLGIFQVSVLHNLVHLLFGVAGLYFARTLRGAIRYLLIGGIIYMVFFFYGIIIDYQSQANFVPFDDSDNFLHVMLGVGMIALSGLLNRGSQEAELVVEDLAEGRRIDDF